MHLVLVDMVRAGAQCVADNIESWSYTLDKEQLCPTVGRHDRSCIDEEKVVPAAVSALASTAVAHGIQ